MVAYSPKIAGEVKEARRERLGKADAWLKEIRARLRHPSGRGRAPTPQGTYDRVRDYLRDHNLLGFYKVELNSGNLRGDQGPSGFGLGGADDGTLMLGITDLESPPANIVKRYKELGRNRTGLALAEKYAPPPADLPLVLQPKEILIEIAFSGQTPA